MNYIAQINHRSELKNKSQSYSNLHQECSKIGNSGKGNIFLSFMRAFYF